MHYKIWCFSWYRVPLGCETSSPLFRYQVVLCGREKLHRCTYYIQPSAMVSPKRRSPVYLCRIDSQSLRKTTNTESAGMERGVQMPLPFGVNSCTACRTSSALGKSLRYMKPQGHLRRLSLSAKIRTFQQKQTSVPTCSCNRVLLGT